MTRLGVCQRLVGLLLACGCHTPAPRAPLPMPVGSPPPLELPVGSPPPFRVNRSELRSLDARTTPAEALAPVALTSRPITEDECRRESARRAPLAAVALDEMPSCPGWREQLVAADRNRSARAALEQFYQLADAEGRGAVVRASLPVLDELRTKVAEAKARGVAVPLDEADLARQRATLLALLSQAELGAGLLDIDLKHRVGVAGRTPERLRPVGPFPPVGPVTVNRDDLVAVALSTRADLRLLRTAALELTPEMLPAALDLLDSAGPDGVPTLPRLPRRVRREAERRAEELAQEVAVRQAQLVELVARRERQVADEVRAAATSLEAQGNQVGLAVWRVEQFEAQLATGPDAGPLARLALRLEQSRAEADLVVAVTTYHQNRVRLLAAQGLLGGP